MSILRIVPALFAVAVMAFVAAPAFSDEKPLAVEPKEVVNCEKEHGTDKVAVEKCIKEQTASEEQTTPEAK